MLNPCHFYHSYVQLTFTNYESHAVHYAKSLTWLLSLSLSLWQHCAAFRILGPQLGTESVSPAVEAQSLHHLTATEVSQHFLI